MKRFFLCLIIVILIIQCRNWDESGFQVFIDEEYNNLFTRTEGWTGGDVAHSIPLSDSTILWVFGDSWIGPVKDGRHYNAAMISNVIAVQRGKDAAAENLSFYFENKDGKPAPFISPADNIGKYWLTDGGIKTDRGLFLFASQVITKDEEEGVFNFEVTGKFLVHIDNPLDKPDNWDMEIKKMPYFHKISKEHEISFGTPQVIFDGHIYIYGAEFKREEKNRYMILARTPEHKIEDFDAWEFFYEGEWQKDITKVTRLCDHFGAEYSVSYSAFLRKYITVYTENGLSDKIILRTAVKPEGPWNPPLEIYETPETKWDKTYFCYAAKAHPELSKKPDELLISYVCNSFDFFKMCADTRIYRPKFIRIRFSDNF